VRLIQASVVDRFTKNQGWSLIMQTETALRITEAEFIALSEDLRTAIPVMNLIEGRRK